MKQFSQFREEINESVYFEQSKQLIAEGYDVTSFLLTEGVVDKEDLLDESFLIEMSIVKPIIDKLKNIFKTPKIETSEADRFWKLFQENAKRRTDQKAHQKSMDLVVDMYASNDSAIKKLVPPAIALHFKSFKNFAEDGGVQDGRYKELMKNNKAFFSIVDNVARERLGRSYSMKPKINYADETKKRNYYVDQHQNKGMHRDRFEQKKERDQKSKQDYSSYVRKKLDNKKENNSVAKRLYAIDSEREQAKKEGDFEKRKNPGMTNQKTG